MAIRSAKLEKLTIEVFEDRARQKKLERIEVMFNPTSFSFSYKTNLVGEAALDSSAPKNTYSHSDARQISLELVFDGTGVVPGSQAGSVSRKVDGFLKSTMQMNGSSHEPNYLRIEWGDGPLQSFDCRMESADVSYSLFDRRGAPLRATIKTTLREDLDDPKKVRIEGKQSPDLTHARVVRAGDTLPLLCKGIYGSSRYYLQVAKANDLDDLRNLVPGSVIRFPPLAK